MTKKDKYNFHLPLPLIGAFEEAGAAGKVGKKEKWRLCSAAVLALLRMPKAEQLELIQAAGKADVDNSFDRLIDAAKRESQKRSKPHIEPEIVGTKPAPEQPQPVEPPPSGKLRARSQGRS